MHIHACMHDSYIGCNFYLNEYRLKLISRQRIFLKIHGQRCYIILYIYICMYLHHAHKVHKPTEKRRKHRWRISLLYRLSLRLLDGLLFISSLQHGSTGEDLNFLRGQFHCQSSVTFLNLVRIQINHSLNLPKLMEV